MIPQDFLTLLNSIQEKIKPTEDDTKTWIAFGKWLGFEEVITKRHVYRHLKGKWKKLQHAIKLRETNNLEVPSIIKKKEEKKQLIISARKSNFNQFRYVTTSECIVDQDNRTLAHLEKLDNYNAIIQATDAINSYYNHILADKSHGSKDFLNNFTEHFGAYARYNMLPYTSSNTASSHNILHRECVNNLLHNLQPLSNSVNKFVKEYYEHYYMKLSKLTWGPFAPRSFGIFPMIAINFNVISNYHWDEQDEPNSLCLLVALGDFEGGELCFPQIQIVVKLRPGQVLAFPSRLLLHGNFKVTRGIRYSVVYFVHSEFFHHLRHFDSIYKECESNKNAGIIGPEEDFNNAQYLNQAQSSGSKNQKKSKKPKITKSEFRKATDQRRNNISKYIYIFKYSYYLNKNSNFIKLL